MDSWESIVPIQLDSSEYDSRESGKGAPVTDVAQLFIDLVRVETRLYNAVDDRLRAEHGLTVGQYELMRFIGERHNCRVYDIVREVAITVGAASKAVDRLERAGWCRRATNPEDRRSSWLTLTPEGKRVLARARPAFEDEITARAAGVVSPRALAQLGKVLDTLRAALEEHQRDRDRRQVGGDAGGRGS